MTVEELTKKLETDRPFLYETLRVEIGTLGIEAMLIYFILALESDHNQQIKQVKIINADDYLIELADEKYETVSEVELNKIYDSADEFDGFTGVRVVGKIKTLGEK